MYEILEVGPIGWIIRKIGTLRIEPHIYEDKEEALTRIQELRESILLKAYWPDAKDKDVETLLTDPNFYPMIDSLNAKEGSVLWRINRACDIVARQRAGIE